MAVRLKLPVRTIIHRMASPSLTSYEIVCATARIAPRRAYFELDAQPDPRIV